MSRSGALPAWVLVGLAAVLAVSGCTASRDKVAPPAVANAGPNQTGIPADLASTKPGQAPNPADRCQQSAEVPATKVVLTTADHVHLAGVVFGTGPHGVLLLPQRGADLCGWWDYANELLGKGFHVLAIDLRGTGFSESGTTADYTADAMAGIAALKQEGASTVVLVGAAIGAATALVTAGRAPGQVSGVVSLSYPDTDVDVTGGTGAAPHTANQAAPHITAPLLLCFTAGDRLAAASAAQQALANATGSPVKQLVGRPGVSDGWDMLKVGGDDVRPDILTFLQSYS
jgi:pimeloyl-ACP methyl ester carboxylesterase